MIQSVAILARKDHRKQNASLVSRLKVIFRVGLGSGTTYGNNGLTMETTTGPGNYTKTITCSPDLSPAKAGPPRWYTCFLLEILPTE